MDIAKEMELSRLTDMQREVDKAFLAMVKRDYIDPLLAELCKDVDGFADGDTFERFQLMLIENEKVGRKGDSLTLEYGGMWSAAYAGKYLGRDCLQLLQDGTEYTYYRPLIYDGIKSGSRVTFRREDGATVYDTETHQFLICQRDEYESLPPAFRVALLAHYINENVIADSADVASYVLGNAKLRLHRWMGDFTVNKDLQRNGWVVRLRDIEPVGALGELIAGNLKATTEKVRAAERDTHILKTESKKRRAGNALTFEMVDCVSRILDAAHERGEKPTHDAIHQAFCQSTVSDECKERYSYARSLMNAFRQYVKSHPEISSSHPGVRSRYDKEGR